MVGNNGSQGDGIFPGQMGGPGTVYASGAERHAFPLRSAVICDCRRSGGGVIYSTVTVTLKVFSGATLSHGRA